MTDIPIVYDVGMNHGEDSAYYLAKGCRVIGIDANSEVCSYCAAKFEREIGSGQMSILNFGVSDVEGRGEFYVNIEKDKISTFMPHKFDNSTWAPKLWKTKIVNTVKLSTIISSYGYPEFVKIDVEYFDDRVLRDLAKSRIKPRYISAECHEMSCFETLCAMGYDKFKLVYGMTVHEDYGMTKIRRVDGSVVDFEFMYDSSGPYGEDLPGRWIAKEEAAAALISCAMGWVDVHACS